MEIKKEVIQIETFFKYAEEGEGKRLESIERLVRVDGEVVQRQQMSPLMYRLDNSPIQQFLSWVKGDGNRDEKPEDYAPLISMSEKYHDKYAGCNSSGGGLLLRKRTGSWFKRWWIRRLGNSGRKKKGSKNF